MKSSGKRKDKGRNESSNPELASRLREWGENYGLEEDPYLEGLSTAIDEGKNLAVWASNDVMTLMPQPNIDSTEGPIYSLFVLVRNVLVFVPVALTWLAVGKATTGFSIYTTKSSAASVVNFLQFWQNGYGVLAKEWTLSHVASDDFFIIATVIILTFITPFMNRSATKKAERFEHDALRERLALVIEVESFLFDKRRLTPLSIDSALAQSFERVVEATHNLAIASARIQTGLRSLPRQIDVDDLPEDDGEQADVFANRKRSRKERREAEEFEESENDSRDVVIRSDDYDRKPQPKFDPREGERIEQAVDNLDLVAKRVDVIGQSLPRRAHARKELKKVEIELDQTRAQLLELQSKYQRQQGDKNSSGGKSKKKKKSGKDVDWRAAKREAERNKARSGKNRLGIDAPSFVDGE